MYHISPDLVYHTVEDMLIYKEDYEGVRAKHFGQNLSIFIFTSFSKKYFQT